MFNCESGFLVHRKKHGQREAVELIADINHYTKLQSPKDKPKKEKNGDAQPGLGWMRTLFDHNEHFIELSNMGEEDRSLMFLVTVMLAIALGWTAPFMGVVLAGTKLFSSDWYFGIVVGGGSVLGFAVLLYFLWPQTFAPTYFTSLRARYRFNRTTRKVYVLRPARYGGNVVLDWDRVQAHVNWCAPREMTHDDLRDPVARQARQDNRGGQFGICGLVLYWPPLDPADKERAGEEVLWVGPKLAGENLWQYIRTFMEEGMDAVPEPTEYEWLRKGFHSVGQHVEETVLGPSRVLDRLGGRAGEGGASIQTSFNFMLNAVWAPLHCLAERLCSWPMFPDEWNSDCGQKRRESGLGPEEPLRWTAR
ncbi:MFS transporter [Variovorax sp. S2]|uniref:MFS transporter n=1 Tax=Variovorax sp. S12S4 TaxID=3029170 RepID=UPI00215B848E|nr:MFS transporter [Variovorax sp. S12S4]MCR8957938.1 MFS transporter [Variovorax sp. S12S4]